MDCASKWRTDEGSTLKVSLLGRGELEAKRRTLAPNTWTHRHVTIHLLANSMDTAQCERTEFVTFDLMKSFNIGL